MNNYLPQQRLRQPSNKQSHIINHVMTGRRTQVKHNNLYDHQNIPSIKASEELNFILNQQRNSKLKAGLGYEEGSSSGHPSNTESMKFFKSSNIDNNHSTETKKENQPRRRNERKSPRTEFVD